MTLPFAADIATPLLLVLLVLSATLLMLRLALGPFAHIRFLHLHQAYLNWPGGLRLALQSVAVCIIVISVLHLLGGITFSRPQ